MIGKRIITQEDINIFLNDGLNSPFKIPSKFSAPISLIWEVTGNCNSNCIYCSGGFPKHINEMNKTDKIKLAREICDMKVFMISLSGGEPLISRDLLELVNIFIENDVSIMICTSGYKINYSIVDALLRLKKVSFNISIDSINDEINDFQRGRVGALKEALNLIEYIRNNELTDTFISIESVATRKNYSGMADLVEYFSKNCNVNEIRIQPVVTMNKDVVENELEISKEELKNCMINVKKFIEEYNSVVSEPSDGYICVRFVDQFKMIKNGLETERTWGGIITPQGEFLLSVYLPNNLGSVFELGTFRETWNKKFSDGWKILKKDSNLSNINCVYDLRKLYVDGLYGG